MITGYILISLVPAEHAELVSALFAALLLFVLFAAPSALTYSIKAQRRMPNHAPRHDRRRIRITLGLSILAMLPWLYAVAATVLLAILLALLL